MSDLTPKDICEMIQQIKSHWKRQLIVTVSGDDTLNKLKKLKGHKFKQQGSQDENIRHTSTCTRSKSHW